MIHLMLFLFVFGWILRYVLVIRLGGGVLIRCFLGGRRLC